MWRRYGRRLGLQSFQQQGALVQESLNVMDFRY